MSADAVSIKRRTAPSATGFARAATVASLAVGAYMSALDNSIVNAVLPVVAQAFRTDLPSVEWVVTTYLLVQGALGTSPGPNGSVDGCWTGGRVAASVTGRSPGMGPVSGSPCGTNGSVSWS